MKITIIGGSGFVGTRLITLLIKQPHVTLLNIDKQQSIIYPEITKIGNVLDLDRLTELLSGTELVVLLAAEHKDNVEPSTLYYNVNVEGMRNTLIAMKRNNISRLIFTSSVAIYGLNKFNPAETRPADPFNDYGRSKWLAERTLQEWYITHPQWNIDIIRPTVIFGEGNRGNVYNLLHQIAEGKFMIIGRGDNSKSMAYVGNVVEFIIFLMNECSKGYHVFNYVDQPDFTMNELVYHVGSILNRRISTIHCPYWLGLLAGYGFDLLSRFSSKKYVVSSVRIKKFCAVTQFDASKLKAIGFKPTHTLKDGLNLTLQYEFGGEKND